jgi:hypothetical protein
VEAGLPVRAASRRPENLSQLTDAGVEVVRMDLVDAESVAEACRGVDGDVVVGLTDPRARGRVLDVGGRDDVTNDAIARQTLYPAELQREFPFDMVRLDDFIRRDVEAFRAAAA